LNEFIDINECSLGTSNCHINAICSNTIGSYECHCKPGFIGNGIECSLCNENEYLVNDTVCISCPKDSISVLGSSSILDCKCTGLNHYLDNQTLTCLPCPLGFFLDANLNTCQSNILFLFCFVLFSSCFWFLKKIN